MKIGILTLVPYDNYGGILQGFALQTVLTRLGHDAYWEKRSYHVSILCYILIIE